jgi:hypothetical protein
MSASVRREAIDGRGSEFMVDVSFIYHKEKKSRRLNELEPKKVRMYK